MTNAQISTFVPNHSPGISDTAMKALANVEFLLPGVMYSAQPVEQ